MSVEVNEVSIPLVDVVEQYMLEKGVTSNSAKFRYIRIAQSGFKNQLHFDVSGVPRLERLCANEYNKSIYHLPSDLIKIRRIFTIGRGGAIELSMNQAMNPVVDECETPRSTGRNRRNLGTLTNLNTDYSSSHVSASEASKRRGTRHTGGYFGLGGGTVYQYRLNEGEGRIEVSDNLYDNPNIFVEYLGLPKKVDGETMVHPFVVEPLLRWIAYAECRFKKNVPANQKQILKRDFYEAKHHAKVQFISTSMRQLIDARRQGFKQSPKY